MAPKIFLTGGTGYIGGSVLHSIVTKHAEYDLTVLLRKTPESFKSCYPNIKIVEGDYDSFDTLADAAAQADVVVHNGDSDHEPSLQALITGLLRRPSSNPGFLLHLSGSGIVSDWHSPDYLGKLNPKIWSDLSESDLASISTLPDHALHRNTEKILFDTISKHDDKLKIAIMCPPDIYGRGLGLAKTWSAFVPMFIGESLKLGDEGRAFYVNEGANARSWVHVQDLMAVYLEVIEAAVAGGEGATWGTDGYYFAGSQEHSHLEIATATGKLLKKHGVIGSAEPLQVDLETLDKMLPHPRFKALARYLFASNSRTRADRATKLFGYAPKAPGLLETLEEDVVAEVKRMRGEGA